MNMSMNITEIDHMIGRLQEMVTDQVRSEVEDYILSLRVACKLLYWDTYQTSLFLRQDLKVDKSKVDRQQLEMLRDLMLHAIREVNIAALNEGKIDKFRDSLAKSIRHLKPIDEFAKEYTIYLCSNAHIDLGWLWRWGETVQICRGTFNNVLDMMEQFPDFTYSQSQAVTYEWMEVGYPDIFARIKKVIE